MAVADAGKVAGPWKGVKVLWYHDIGAVGPLDKARWPA